MIDYVITIRETGKNQEYFDSRPQSHKKVYRICDQCLKESWVEFRLSHKLCRSCSSRGKI